MPKRLSQEEYCQRVHECVGNKYVVLSQYQGKNRPVTFYCNEHNMEFTIAAECFMRGKEDVRGKCPQCLEAEQKLRYSNQRTKVICAYCGMEFYKANSKLANSKSGMYFCCREHKDLAQCLNSGPEFEKIRPEHYTSSEESEGTIYTYRNIALRSYPHECAICGWNEDIDVLEVHHIDENRSHNELDNLIVLCPICHRKLTSHKYQLIDRHSIILK